MSLPFESFIHQVHKQVHPSLSLSGPAKSKLNGLTNALIKDFIKHLVVFTEHGRKNTISSREVQSAVRVVFYGDLAKHAISEGVKAVTKYTSSYNPKKRTSGAEKAGLKFPPARIRSIIKSNVDDYKTNVRVSETSSVYLAAVVEYVIAEILELSGNVAIGAHRKKITGDDITTAIMNDIELRKSLYCILETPVYE